MGRASEQQRPQIEVAPGGAVGQLVLLEPDGSLRSYTERADDVLHLTGRPPGSDPFHRIDPIDRPGVLDALTSIAHLPGAEASLDVRCSDGGGGWLDLRLTLSNRLADPDVRGLVLRASDRTHRRREEITLGLETHLLELLPTAIIITDDRGVVVHWNAEAEAIYGHRAEQALGRPIATLDVGPSDAALAEALMQGVLERGRWQGDFEARRADGEPVAVHTTVVAVDAPQLGFRGIIGASLENGDRRRMEADLAFQARHDDLTGLPNRRRFVEHLEDAVLRAHRGSTVAVLFADVDDFKDINDLAGHAAGDRVLVEIAARLVAVVDGRGMVARLGGDEFVVCCERLAGPRDARRLAEEVLAAVSTSSNTDDAEVPSLSMGVSVWSPGVHGEALLRNADMAMYLAKENGKARVELFDDAVQQRTRRRHALVADLGNAVDAGLMETFFQPQIDLRSGLLRGFEALVRWRHPRQGLLAPSTFLPLAEESGLIATIDRHVLETACRAMARWRTQNARDLELAVNVSARQLADPQLPALVARTLETTGLPAELLCLEVTEHSLLETATGVTALATLGELGVRIAIDDFGVGYSSLGRLRHLPVDLIKVDRSFIEALGQDPDAEVIVGAVVGLAKALDLEIVAEGIETNHQLTRVVALGCDYGQGFLWSRPVDEREAASLAAGSLRLGAIPAAHDHLAMLHGNDDELLVRLTDHFSSALSNGHGAVVIATPEHRSALEAALRKRGIDLDDPSTPFLALDAATTLESFLIDGAPDAARFHAVACAALQTVGVGSRPVSAYGEMVGILWDDRNLVGAMQLEGLWEHLRTELPFSLLCGYRVDPGNAAAVAALHEASGLHHSHVELPGTT